MKITVLWNPRLLKPSKYQRSEFDNKMKWKK